MSQEFLGFIGIQQEPTWKSIKTNSMQYVYGMSESVTVDIARFEYKNVVATLTEPDDMTGLRSVKGLMVAPLFGQTAWHLFKGLMMVQSNFTITAVGSTWQATYTSPNGYFNNTIPRPSHTLEIYRDVTSSFQYSGVVFSQADIQIDINQPALMALTVIAGDTDIMDKTAPVYTDNAKPLAFDTCSIGISGIGINALESFTLSIDNQIDEYNALNASVKIAGIKTMGVQTAKFSGSMDFENLTEYEKFVNQTTYNMNVSLTQSAGTLEQIIFTFPKIVYTNFTPSISDKGPIVVEMEGKMNRHTGSATTLQIDIITQYDHGYFVVGHPVYGIIGDRIIF